MKAESSRAVLSVSVRVRTQRKCFTSHHITEQSEKINCRASHNFTGSGSGPGPRLTGPGPVCDFWAGPGPGPAVKKAKKIPNFLKMTSVASNENLSIQANEIYSRAKITPDNNNKVK